MAAKGPDQARAAAAKPKPTKIKVKQDMIDSIKGQGMARALKRAAEIKATGAKGEAEFLEGVRRMYGERRLAEATAAVKANTSSKSPNQPAPKTAAYAAGKKGVTNKASDYKSPTKSTTSKAKSNEPAKNASIMDKLKWVGKETLKGTAKDVLTFGAGGASVGAGLGAKAALKAGAYAAKKGALSTSGRVAAKAGKAVSQNQYDAMLANASKIGKVATAKSATKAAAKTVAKTTTAAAKTTAKKAVAVKTATSKAATNTGAKLRTADEARMLAMKTPKGKKK